MGPPVPTEFRRGCQKNLKGARVRTLIWFTRDLRTEDNQIFQWLPESSHELMAVAFEPVDVSAFQLRFFHQSVLDLQSKLGSQNVSLTLLRGRPETEIPKLTERNQIEQILVSKPYNSRDEARMNEVLNRVPQLRTQMFDQSTLLRLEDLPFPLAEMPRVFTNFRKKIEANLVVAKPLGTSVSGLVGFTPEIPNACEAVDLEASLREPLHLPYSFEGGERAAWGRVEEYIWRTESLSHYKETRNGLLEKNDSSKFSPWLANGSLSARSLYGQVKKFEMEKGANESTYWMFFELLWRDYFKFLALQIGDRLFSRQGLSDRVISTDSDPRVFEAWCRGEVGVDFVDANMIELLVTGWMSNRGRQNVASYLAKGLEIDWTWGARYFESQLLDADPESNWGNWLYTAGVGTDPRDRLFNIERQAEMYDPDGAYRKRWLQRRPGK